MMRFEAENLGCIRAATTVHTATTTAAHPYESQSTVRGGRRFRRSHGGLVALAVNDENVDVAALVGEPRDEGAPEQLAQPPVAAGLPHHDLRDVARPGVAQDLPDRVVRGERHRLCAQLLGDAERLRGEIALRLAQGEMARLLHVEDRPLGP